MGPSYAKGERGKKASAQRHSSSFFPSEKRREVAGRKRGFKGKQDKKKLGRLCGLAREKRGGHHSKFLSARHFTRVEGEGGEGGGGQREKVSKVWDSPDNTDLFQESLNSCCIVLNRHFFFLFFLSNYELIVCRIPPLVPSVSILRPLFMG